MRDFEILAIDLSKDSTGLALFKCRNGALSVSRLHSIQPINASNYSKTHFYAKQLILSELETFLETSEWKNFKNFSIALEYPVFGASYSELTFYLTQSLLEYFDNLGIDVVGYAVPTLQSFIRKCSHDRKPPKKLNLSKKLPIRKIYEQCLYPYMNWLPNPVGIKNSDEMDAFFLGLMASYFQGPLLQQFLYQRLNLYNNLVRVGFGEFQAEYPEIFKLHNGEFHQRFLDRFKNKDILDVVPFNNVDILRYGLFKTQVESFKKRDFLSLKSPLFFPFNKRKVLELAINAYSSEIRKWGKTKQSNDLMIFMTQAFNTVPRHIHKVYEETFPSLRISFNRKGNLFFIRGCKRVWRERECVERVTSKT